MSVAVPDAVDIAAFNQTLNCSLARLLYGFGTGPSVCLSLMPMIAHGIVALPNSPALTVYVRIGTPSDVEGSLIVL